MAILGKEAQDVVRALQHEPFAEKVARSRAWIEEWIDRWDHNVSVSYSGGLDSTVLLHLVREIWPDCPAIFADTGLEYPEIKEQVKHTPNVQTIRPKLTFRQVLEKCGYPVVSKRVAQYVKEVQHAKGETATKRLRLTGIASSGRYSAMGKIPAKWQYLVDAPFKISDRCCYYLKKKPLEEMPHPFVGTRAEESNQRLITLVQFGVNAYEIATPHSTPLAYWTEADVWWYIDWFHLPVAKVYLGENPLSRTGCMFCMFGVHLEKPNRFQVMAITHPQQYDYCINNLGLGEILDYLGVDYSPLEPR